MSKKRYRATPENEARLQQLIGIGLTDKVAAEIMGCSRSLVTHQRNGTRTREGRARRAAGSLGMEVLLLDEDLKIESSKPKTPEPAAESTTDLVALLEGAILSGDPDVYLLGAHSVTTDAGLRRMARGVTPEGQGDPVSTDLTPLDLTVIAIRALYMQGHRRS